MSPIEIEALLGRMIEQFDAVQAQVEALAGALAELTARVVAVEDELDV